MVKVTLKGILAHKIRFLLTGVAVILGVAFIAGTLVLTATINKTFDGLFANIYANTDAVGARRRRSSSVDVRRRREVGSTDSVIPLVRKTAGRRAGGRDGPGARAGHQQEERGAEQGPGRTGPRASRGSRTATSAPSTVTDGTGRPQAPNEIVIDKNTADKTKYKIGDYRPRPHEGRPRRTTSWSESRSSAMPTACSARPACCSRPRPRAGSSGSRARSTRSW